ncbi:MAG: chemotaxis protein CheW [Rhodanobacteraceae bacterium]|nr:chemotaxis protein CheW [Rhodanobacteraceae bacterium]
MNSSEQVGLAGIPVTELASPAVGLPAETGDSGEPRYAVKLALPDGDPIGLALPPQCQTEMVHGVSLCPIPNAPRWFVGMLNLRGNLIPVFDVMASLLTNAPLAVQRAVLVIGTGDSAFAILIPSEPELVFLSTREAVPENTPAEVRVHTQGAYRVDQALWLEFQFDRWIAQCFAGATRGRAVRRVSLLGT